MVDLFDRIVNAGFARKAGFPSKGCFDAYLKTKYDLQEEIDENIKPGFNQTVDRLKRKLLKEFGKRKEEIAKFIEQWMPPPKPICLSKPERINLDEYPEIKGLVSNLQDACVGANLVLTFSITNQQL